ncbi:MAG: hypothetical protein IJJ41_07405, partial [Clostridia bacterium]|nr:hypothetical protein [Clostridia bacterium]
EYTAYCKEKIEIKVLKEMLLGTSALIVFIPMYRKQRLAKTQNRCIYGDFVILCFKLLIYKE